ncbi:hypothetical protein EON81_05450 [bacterium]|nr:MAG: hypothetical protein EON81_05450 [bacterium]
MTPVYNRLSSQVPPPLPAYPPTSILSGLVTPTGITQLSQGMTVGVSEAINGYFRVALALGQIGGNGPGIASGFEIDTPGGMTVSVSAGTAMIDRIVQKAASTYVISADNSTVYLWLYPTAVVAHTTSLTVPNDGDALFLATVTTSGGAVTGIDYSGRVEIRDGLRYRRVADVGRPADEPGSSVSIVTRTQRGEYLWRGEAHMAIVGDTLYVDRIQGDTGAVSGGYLEVDVSASDVVLTPSQLATLGLGTLVVKGAPASVRTVLVETLPGNRFQVVNESTKDATVRTPAEGSAITIPAAASVDVAQTMTGFKSGSPEASEIFVTDIP